MKLYLAGGCGEHGRTCFLVQGEAISCLVDCGLMQGDKAPYPRLAWETIKELDYIFLTHSHVDHVGALQWLYENGFSGEVVLSGQTMYQMRCRPQRYRLLEYSAVPCRPAALGKITLMWGYSGHCVGSVWYLLEAEGKRLFFSGDYLEDSGFYHCDRARNLAADLAVIDCAYGGDSPPAQSCRSIFMDHLINALDNGRQMLLPVPKYGRGLEILLLLEQLRPGTVCFLDKLLGQQVGDITAMESWCRVGADAFSRLEIREMECLSALPGSVALVSDPQLDRQSSRELCMAAPFEILLSGHVDLESYSKYLLEREKAVFRRFPVHQGIGEVELLYQHNAFERVLLYHCGSPVGGGMDWVVQAQTGEYVEL